MSNQSLNDRLFSIWESFARERGLIPEVEPPASRLTLEEFYQELVYLLDYCITLAELLVDALESMNEYTDEMRQFIDRETKGSREVQAHLRELVLQMPRFDRSLGDRFTANVKLIMSELLTLVGPHHESSPSSLENEVLHRCGGTASDLIGESILNLLIATNLEFPLIKILSQRNSSDSNLWQLAMERCESRWLEAWKVHRKYNNCKSKIPVTPPPSFDDIVPMFAEDDYYSGNSRSRRR